MATISKRSADSVFSINKFQGMIESIDGEADLPLGMAQTMRNFKVTREGNLKVRPGYTQKHKLGAGPIRCLWSGYVAGASVFLAISDGHLWQLLDEVSIDCGTVNDGHASIFGFAGCAYILAGGEYYKWDGESVSVVDGYIPLITVATAPAGGGTTHEHANKLTGKRRQRFSPDGTATTFKLAEAVVNVLSIERFDGQEVPSWTVDGAEGTVTFATAPALGTDCLEILYDAGSSDRSAVQNMKYAEIYGGTTDSRVFLYGDGSNRTLYSEIDGNGIPSAEYFPDLNIINAGESNTPITGMIRHFSRLLVFKIDGGYSIATSAITLADGSVTAAFYITPTQRDVGNDAIGQVRLVGNNPRTISCGAIYEWKSNSGTLSDDERSVKKVSERIELSLRAWDTKNSICFDDERASEWYMIHDGNVIVHNYGNDSWYLYDNIPAVYIERHGKKLFFGTNDGGIMHFDEDYRSDNGAPIDAYWESGMMSFGRDWQTKYSSDIWVAMKSAVKSRAKVTVSTDKSTRNVVREISANIGSSFRAMDFANFSFARNLAPKVTRARIKVKKFVYYSLIISSNSADQTATLLGIDFKVRYTGNVK